MFGLQWSIDVLAMVIIGGIGLRCGPIIGAVFVVVLAELLADYPDFHVAITRLILIVVIRFAPKGLAGLASKLVRILSIAARKASRHDRSYHLTAKRRVALYLAMILSLKLARSRSATVRSTGDRWCGPAHTARGDYMIRVDGAGKSTLVGLLGGAIRASSGEDYLRWRGRRGAASAGTDPARGIHRVGLVDSHAHSSI